MKYSAKREALLLLEDGTLFKGNAIGKIGTSGGEICFNTGMTGYQEVYTDPSYFGQIIVNTNSHIGNYGVLDEETESGQPQISGLVVNSFSAIASRNLSDSSLQEYLEENGIVGISDIDTRRLVRHIRTSGAMNGIISSEISEVEALEAKLKEVPSMAGLELSSQVSTIEPYYLGEELNELKVAVLDIGVKKSILKNLTDRGCYCKVFPAKTTFQEMNEWGANGYFISNGPGDPSVMEYAVDTVREILKADKPLFGICLGHQLLARANEISTYKMHHGHRGLNHPVKNLQTGKGEITSQNHGFSISGEDVEKSQQVFATHINLNDQTIEGIRVKDKKAFSVQYHPESSPGPHDSRYLFDDFVEIMKNS
ncbi:glutamine-hydrolyzing carbamoyl-phosphate synthase small subunit [Xanthovirga aplysinae]|uniref:glutamine-hydrolyzing carbamoyl-phosphate synthase small subunit n=1 Tax=Xanthovirga aplysinae TaxID=2529853 RepID=UPI0012BBC3BF|nr:glutamine-hydrolyzing carbamoyl-phosphate synthase small subunit [Xanthovirga aplysinae]MTI29740.1 carbamoyl-phosphate synthase small subunit [Xanthovirga aplysinae]